MLLTNTSSLSGATRSGLQQLKTKRVIILGGTASISQKVVAQLKAMNLSVLRIQGKNRYELAANVAKQMKSVDTAVIVNGSVYADAVAIAPYAAKQGFPILLTDARAAAGNSQSIKKQSGETDDCDWRGNKCQSSSLSKAAITRENQRSQSV